MVENTRCRTKTGDIQGKRRHAGLAGVGLLLPLFLILASAFTLAQQTAEKTALKTSGQDTGQTAQQTAPQAAGRTPGQTAPQSVPRPQAASLLDAFVEKIGGRAAFDKIVNRRTTSTMTLSMLPAPAEVTTILTKAGPFRVVVNSQAIGKVEYGSDGLTVWEINPMSGPQIKEGLERKRFQCLYGLDLPMRWREVFKTVECTGLGTVEDKPAFKVQAVSIEDYAVTYYFDQVSGLLVKIEYPMETAIGRSIQEVLLRDYRSVDGILFPHFQVRREFGREMTLAFKAVEHNVVLPEDAFVLPEAIRKINQAGR